MKNRRPLNIYDMTQVVQIGQKFYEKLNKHYYKEKYRVTSSVGSDDYDYVTDKKMIARLDKVFKVGNTKDEA